MHSEAELRSADFAARQAALDVSRSFIVQAPAGSGKTELLIQRYLRLLAVVENPEEVLAITFTRKAAAEMRLRVVFALQAAQRGDTPEAAHEKTTLQSAARVLERSERLQWDIMANPRRLRIQTLDSLNASIARMQPITAGAGSGSQAVDMAEMQTLYRRAAAATLDWIGDSGAAGKSAENVLLHLDNNTGIYTAYLAQMLGTRDQWLPFVSTGVLDEAEATGLRERFEESLRKVVAEHVARLAAQLPREHVAELAELADFAASNLGDPGQTAINLNASPDALPSWIAAAAMCLKVDGDWRKQINKTIGFPADNKAMKARLSDLLEVLREQENLRALLDGVRKLPPAAYSDEQWSVLLALFRLLPVAVAELKRLSTARGITDYIEIALSAAAALGSAESPGDVALLLDYQLRHILIDEMQDTSKAQYRMLEALTGGWQAGEGRSLFCVGDPMQSIYRFRNAEVAQFLLAKTNGIGQLALEPLLLRQNFRSGEHLVHWFNTVFPLVLAYNDDAVRGAVSYSEAVPVKHMAKLGDVSVYPVLGSAKEIEASTSAEVIRQTLAAHPDDTMAVLVRQRSQLPALLQQLRDQGTAYQAVDIDRLTDLPEIIDILALTRALLHFGDRVAWLGLLRSPWAGLTWRDLHTLVYGARHESVWECLNDAERVGELSAPGREIVQRFARTLAPFLANDLSTPLHRRAETAWLAMGGPAILSDAFAVENVYRFLEILASLEVGGNLADVVELQNQLDAELVSNNTAARLQILTMHKAKGLQFDHVLLHGLGRQPRARTPDVLSWFDLPDQHGSEEKIISPVGRRDLVERDPLHQFIGRVEAEKDAHEKGRVLYVACTRARKSLHLVGHAEATRNGERLRRPVASSLLSLIWPIIEDRYQEAFADWTAPDEDKSDDVWLEPLLRRVEPPWQMPAIPALPGKKAETSVQAVAEYEVEYYWVGSEARLAGTVVHRWLQLAAEGRVRLSAEKIDSLRPTSERWLLELGSQPDEIGATSKRVASALAAVLEDERGRWLIDGPGRAEFALSAAGNDKIESIVIDRIRIDTDGTHWIVDYKTSTHEGGKLENFIDAEVRRYQGQLKKYARIYRDFSGAPVRGALYFPLLRKFVEVDV